MAKHAAVWTPLTKLIGWENNPRKNDRANLLCDGCGEVFRRQHLGVGEGVMVRAQRDQIGNCMRAALRPRNYVMDVQNEVESTNAALVAVTSGRLLLVDVLGQRVRSRGHLHAPRLVSAHGRTIGWGLCSRGLRLERGAADCTCDIDPLVRRMFTSGVGASVRVAAGRGTVHAGTAKGRSRGNDRVAMAADERFVRDAVAFVVTADELNRIGPFGEGPAASAFACAHGGETL